jgi:hypothetical protein
LSSAFGAFGSQLDRTLKRRHCLIDLSGLHQRHAEIVPALGIGGIGGDEFAISRDRFVDAALTEQRVGTHQRRLRAGHDGDRDERQCPDRDVSEIATPGQQLSAKRSGIENASTRLTAPLCRSAEIRRFKIGTGSSLS